MKKYILFLLLVNLAANTFCHAQDMDIRFDGSQPPQPEVLKLMDDYVKASTGWTTIEERDRKRKNLVAKGYFYHGHDGNPIKFDGLNARQTTNNLQVDEFKYYDIILFQYENTAMVTYKSYGRGDDKGKPFEDYGSGILTMGKEGGEWKVLADIIGKEPRPQVKPTK